METRASYLIVGGFVIALIAALFIFVIWLGRIQVVREYTTYRTYFSGSVTGLQASSAVRYRGVPVGSVTRIRIDPDNVEQIEVTMEIDRQAPIKEDTVASLESQGLTGVGYVLLSRGTQAAPPLRPKPGHKFAIIQSQPSELQRLFTGAPELIDRVNVLVAKATLLFSEHNENAIADTLDNVRTLTGVLASKSDEIGFTIDQAAAAAKEFRQATVSLDALTNSLRGDAQQLTKEASTTLASADTFLDDADARVNEVAKEAIPAVAQLHNAADSFNRLANDLDGLVKENRRPLNDFSNEGLYEFTQFLVEARRMVEAITRLANRIEADPARFFFGNQQQGVPAR